MRIELGVTPGSTTEPARATGRETSAAAVASASATRGRRRFRGRWRPMPPSPSLATAREELSGAAGARRRRPGARTYEDEDDAVDDGRPTRLLRFLADHVREEAREILPLRPEGDELDEDRSEHEPDQPAGSPTTIPVRRRVKRGTGNVSGLTYRVRHDEEARPPPIGSADPEGERLVAGQAHAREDHGQSRCPARLGMPSRCGRGR